MRPDESILLIRPSDIRGLYELEVRPCGLAYLANLSRLIKRQYLIFQLSFQPVNPSSGFGVYLSFFIWVSLVEMV